MMVAGLGDRYKAGIRRFGIPPVGGPLRGMGIYEDDHSGRGAWGIALRQLPLFQGPAPAPAPAPAPVVPVNITTSKLFNPAGRPIPHASVARPAAPVATSASAPHSVAAGYHGAPATFPPRAGAGIRGLGDTTLYTGGIPMSELGGGLVPALFPAPPCSGYYQAGGDRGRGPAGGCGCSQTLGDVQVAGVPVWAIVAGGALLWLAASRRA